jgi:hypothetical protein
MKSKSLFKIFLVMILGISLGNLGGCASYNGGGDAAGWAQMENEMIVATIVMAPIAIALSPITLPVSMIQNSVNNHNEFEQQQQREHMRNAIVQTQFLPLDDNQFSFPILYYHNDTFRAWIPVSKTQLTHTNDVNALSLKYQTIFEKLVNQSRVSPGLTQDWRAFRYDDTHWMFFNQQCEALGVNDGSHYHELDAQMKTQLQVIQLQHLCEAPGN